MGDGADALNETIEAMYEGLIADGATPEEASQRVQEVDWSMVNPFEIYMDEMAFWDDIERREYEAYLRSEEWRARVALVWDRERAAQGQEPPLCQKCGRKSGQQVHHRTYAHLYEEPLEDLELLCGPCHLRLHAQPGAPRAPRRLAGG